MGSGDKGWLKSCPFLINEKQHILEKRNNVDILYNRYYNKKYYHNSKINRGDTIEIRYRDRKVEKLCTDFQQAKKSLNVRAADKLYSLLDTLKMGNDLQEIFDMRMYYLHPLKGDREGEFALDLGRSLGYRLIIIPLDADGNRWKIFDLKTILHSTKIVLVWEVTNHYE